jgi:hypothetical protein
LGPWASASDGPAKFRRTGGCVWSGVGGGWPASPWGSISELGWVGVAAGEAARWRCSQAATRARSGEGSGGDGAQAALEVAVVVHGGGGVLT